MVKEQDVTDAFFDWLIEKSGDMDEYIQARFIAGTASTSILEPLPELPVERVARDEAISLPRLNEKLTQFSWNVAYQTCCDVVGGKAQVDCIIKDLVSWGKIRQDNPSHYDRNEWLLIYDFCKKEANTVRDPKSLNRWSYNSAVFIERCREALRR